MMKVMNVLLAVCGLSVMAADVRVRVADGVPQLQVDGVPVRARWFFGGPEAQQLVVKPGGQWIEFDTAVEEPGNTPLTMHFRFDHKPTNIWLDRFEVIDKTDGTVFYKADDFNQTLDKLDADWMYFPRDERNTVGTFGIDPTGGLDGGPALHVTLKDPTNGKWPDFHFYTVAKPMNLQDGHIYKVKVWIKTDVETKFIFAGYRPASPVFIRRLRSNMIGGMFRSQVAFAHEAGVDFITPSVPMPWPKEGEEISWRQVDAVVEQVLMANPQAKIIPRVGLEPPQWWKDENPGETMKWLENKINHGSVVSVSSLKWRKEAGEHLRALIEYMDTKYPDTMAGYHPCAQNTSEWFYRDSWQQEFHGYSDCEQAGFRRWLAKKYGTDAALQAAWRNPNVTLATAVTPLPKERREAAVYGMLLLPGEAQPVLDHNLFLQDEMTDALMSIAHVVRDATKGHKLSVYFYGYGFEFSTMGRMSACGHLAMRRLLECPDIDILCSPLSYYDRLSGGGGHIMTVCESVTNSGKMWLVEDDTRTYLAAGGSLGGLSDYVRTPWESHQVLLRNTGEEIVRNLACWWMDLCTLGWYNDRELWKEMRRLGPMEVQKLAKPMPYRPPVAVVFDEYSAAYTKDGGRVSGPMIGHQRKETSHLGAASGQYLLDDLLAGKVSSKLLMMLNPWVLDDAKRAQLKKVIDGRFVFWLHAPGIMDPVKGLDLAASKALTGYELVRVENAETVITATATARGRELGLPENWPVMARTPLLMAVKPVDGDEILATWPDGSAAVVMRANSIYCGTPRYPWALARLAAQRAGIHLYTDTDCVFYTDGMNMVLHGTKDGVVTISLPRKAIVYDVVTDKAVTTEAVDKLEVPLKFAETRILRY